MNVPILAHNTRIAQRNVGQGSPQVLPSAGPDSRRVKLLAVAIAAFVLGSVTLPVVGMAEDADEACDGVLRVHPSDNLARVAAVHAAHTTVYCNASGTDKNTTHVTLIGSRHVAFSMRRAG